MTVKVRTSYQVHSEEVFARRQYVVAFARFKMHSLVDTYIAYQNHPIYIRQETRTRTQTAIRNNNYKNILLYALRKHIRSLFLDIRDTARLPAMGENNQHRNITFQLRFFFHLLLLLCMQSLVERPNWFLLTHQQYTYFSVDDIRFRFLYFYGPAFRLFLTQIRTSVISGSSTVTCASSTRTPPHEPTKVSIDSLWPRCIRQYRIWGPVCFDDELSTDDVENSFLDVFSQIPSFDNIYTRIHHKTQFKISFHYYV